LETRRKLLLWRLYQQLCWLSKGAKQARGERAKFCSYNLGANVFPEQLPERTDCICDIALLRAGLGASPFIFV